MEENKEQTTPNSLDQTNPTPVENEEITTLKAEIENLKSELGETNSNLVKALKQRDEANKAFLSSQARQEETRTFSKLMEDIE